VSVRTADVVLMTCRTNIAGLQPGIMEPCRSASENDRRQLELHTLWRSQPVETGERVGDVARASQAGDESCGSVEYRLEAVVQVPWYAYQYSIIVVQSGRQTSALSVECCRMQNGKAAGNGFPNVASHAEVRVEVNSEISDCLRRVDEVGPDPKS